MEPALLTSLACSWHAPWLVTALAQQGPYHYQNQQPMQDAHRLAVSGSHLIMAVADGVGTQPLSHLGSATAVSAAVDHLLATLTDAPPTAHQVTDAMAAAHDALVKLSKAKQVDVTTLATTFIVAVVSDNRIAAAGIGDSSILSVTHSPKNDAFPVAPFLAMPQPKEKGTWSLTAPDWRFKSCSRVDAIPRLKAVFLGTDGAETFFTLDSTIPVASPLDAPALATIDPHLVAHSPTQLYLLWASYLASYPPKDHDDRTILLAFRPSVPPPLPPLG